MFYRILRLIALALFKLLFRLEVSGQTNIPLRGGVILASNHVSYLDPIGLGVASTRPLYFLAKEELFKGAFFNWFFAHLNSLPVKSGLGGFKSLRRAIKELRSGRALAIFPEGRRVAGGQLGKPMKGIGFTAAKAGVCIVPTFIEGSEQALPRQAKFIRLRKIKVYFGRAFWPKEFSGPLKKKDYYDKITRMTMEEIQKLKERRGEFLDVR
jgi:1-acyl-sn-glycerol-3-phosphate acyltransferase